MNIWCIFFSHFIYQFVEYGNEMSCAMKLALCVGQGRNHIFYPDGQPQTEPRDICFYFDAENIQIDEIMETVRRLTGAKVVFEERGEGTSTIAPRYAIHNHYTCNVPQHCFLVLGLIVR